MRLVVLCIVLASIASPQPGNPEQLFREAVAAQQRGDDALAVRTYQQLLKLRPDVLEARVNLGAALARLSRFDEAIEQYRTALAQAPAAAAPGLRLNLALAWYKKGDMPEALKLLRPLHDADPGNVRTAALLADVYARTGQDSQVVAVLTPIAAAHPDDLGVAWLLGSTLIRSGKQREGLVLVERVAKSANSAEAYLLAGQTALKLSEFELARDHAAAGLRINPRLPGLLTLRGSVLQYLGDDAGSIDSLRKALEANPNDFEAHLNLGAVLLTERQLEESRRHLERALQLNPSSTLALYAMARLERTDGKLDAAVKLFEKVIHDDPEWPEPHVELAAVYFRLNRKEDGERERATFDRLSAKKQDR